jgi:hypothetical protein
MINKMKTIFFSLLLTVFISVMPVFGQKDTTGTKNVKSAKQKDSFALFGSDQLLEITLKFDLTTFLKKNTNGGPLDAVVTFNPGSKDSLTRNIKIKNRGNYRFENCDFPPMELNFKKAIHAYPDSGNIKKLKLVTHCKTGAVQSEYVLREYLVYKMFNLLTDTSFRVRLLRVTYIDTRKNRKPVIQYGFFIEPISVLAERTNSTILKATNLTQKHIEPDVMDKISIFNYMVSNWDWTVPLQHNIAIIKPMVFSNSGLGLAIPYDFDLTGVVNVDYAVTPPEYNLRSIRDRVFLGICRSRDVFQKDLLYFLSRKNDFYSLINDFPYLNEKSKKDIIDFLNQFFNQIEKQKELENLIDYLMGNCKNL